MLAANWEKHDASTNTPKNYFADRQKTEKILKNIEKTIKKQCFYCKACSNCQKFETYKKEFDRRDFWSFNKPIKCWDVHDPDWSFRNRVFELRPIRPCKF